MNLPHNSLAVGDTVRLRTFRHYNTLSNFVRSVDFTAPEGQVFVAILIGQEKKDLESIDQSLDPNEVLRSWGWTKNVWIPVSSGKLPPSGEDVFVFGKGRGFAGAGEIRIGRWYKAEGQTPAHWNTDDFDNAEVTHWMPQFDHPTEE